LISVKECVITHLPNELVLKMDDAEIVDLDWLLRTQRSSLVKERVGRFSTVERCDHNVEIEQ